MEIEAIKNKIDMIYKDVLGFDKSEACPKDDIENWINMSQEDLDLLSPDDCVFISFKILRHTIHLQSKASKIKSLLDHLNYYFRKVLAPEAVNYKGSWENVEALAINGNAWLSDLKVKILEFKGMLEILEPNIRLLNELAKKYDALKFRSIKNV